MFSKFGIRLALCVLNIALVLPACAQPERLVRLASSDVAIELAANPHAPQLVSMSGHVSQGMWRNQSADSLPAAVEVAGKPVAITWQLRRDLGRADEHQVTFVYECKQPAMRLKWIWTAATAFGPLEHFVEFDNLSESEIWLPLMNGLSLRWQTSPKKTLVNFYVEKGADTPSAVGVHQESIADGYRWTGRSTTYARPEKDQAREIIPAEFVYQSSEPGKGSGWFAGIEFSGRTRIHLERKGAELNSELGLDPEPGPYRTRLGPAEHFITPTVFLGAFDGGPDGAGNQLRPWIRAVLGNPAAWQDPQYPVLTNNSWGSGMQVDEKLALRMIGESKELGLEMFHLDAGWFRGVGDWYADEKKFPHGLSVVADEAHRLGLRFGIWVDWTQAGLDISPGALNVHDAKVRDWMIADVKQDWKPEPFKGQTIDLGMPAAREWSAHEVKRLVEDNHLDMLEHDGYLVAKGCLREDHPHAAPVQSTIHITHDWGSDFILASNSTDVSDHAVRAYYSIYEQLRREHPGLLLEICNDGGRMVDFGSAAHGDYFSITDTYDPLSNRRAFYDASYVLPAAMLESYVEKWPTPTIANFRYMLRSGMMGWTTIMLDTTAWSSDQHAAAKAAIALYKTQLRPLIRDAKLYHVSERPDGVHWDGLEYWNAPTGKGALFAFRGTIQDEAHHTFLLHGLNPRRLYRLHFEDGSAPDREIPGAHLMGAGLTVSLGEPLSSELIFVQEAGLDNLSSATILGSPAKHLQR